MGKALVAAPLAFGVLFIVAAVGAMAGTPPVAAGAGITVPSAVAIKDIPAALLPTYESAAASSGIDWPVLAAIGKVETDHCRSTAPGVHSGANGAGAEGCMQFLPGTWAKYGGGGSPYDPADAIPAAARYLAASGAPGDYHAALFAYNHAEWYVRKVLAIADAYRGAAPMGSSGAGYVNPFPVGQWLPGRTDQGLDMCPVGSQPVRLIGAATIGKAERVDSGWLGGGEVTYTLVEGDHAGLSVYFAEDFQPSVRPSSRVLPAGTVIGVAHPGHHCIEQGFAAGPRTDLPATPYGPLVDGSNTPGGLAMTRWMRELGAATEEDPGASPDTVPRG